MAKVFICIGHGVSQDGSWDSGCVYGNYSEAALMKPIVGAAVEKLRAIGGIEVHTDWPDNGMNVAACVEFANGHDVDIYISVHCDYSLAPSGTLPIVHPGSTNGMRLAACLNNSWCLRIGMGTRGIIQGDYWETSDTYMPACIFETGSIKADLDTLLNRPQECGHALAYGVADYFGISYNVAPPSPADKTKPTGTPPYSDRNPCYTDHFGIWVDDIKDDSGIAHADVAVWTHGNGQDDIKWYPMAQGQNDPRWRVSIDLKKHGRWVDNYICHVYATDKAGNQGFIGQTIVQVRDLDKNKKGSAIIEVAKPEVLVTGSNSVLIKQPKHPELNIDKVRIAVWPDGTEPKPSNWIACTKTAAGNWSATFDVAKVGNVPGNYNIHVYGEDSLQDKPNNYLGCDMFSVYTQEQRDAEQDRLIAELQERVK